MKIENIKVGKKFNKDERILKIEDDEDNFLIFETGRKAPDNKGFILTKYFGVKEGENLKYIHPTGKEAKRHYQWGVNCVLKQEGR